MPTTQKLRKGATETWFWFAPESASAATVTFALDSGAVSLALTPVVASVAITAAIDRRTLTASAAPAMSGIQGEPYGQGWLITAEDGVHPVVIAQVDGTTLTLAEPLPRNIDATGAVFIARAHRTEVTGADVTATGARNMLWAVEYTAVGAGDMPADDAEDSGLLDVVIAPWTSGLTHADLVAQFPGLAESFPARSGNWDAQITAADIELQARLDADVAKGMQSDDIESNHEQLRQVHALMSAAKCVEIVNMELAERWLTQALGVMSSKTGVRHGGLYALATKDLWVDDNQDGVVDEGEIKQVTGPRASWVGGSTFRARAFTVGGDDW